VRAIADLVAGCFRGWKIGGPEIAPQWRPGRLREGWAAAYQYQWWVLPRGAELIGGFEVQGVHGQFLYIKPEEHLVIVTTSAWLENWNSQLEDEFYYIFRRLQDETSLISSAESEGLNRRRAVKTLLTLKAPYASLLPPLAKHFGASEALTEAVAAREYRSRSADRR
jgi:CubicO group peptidase (beta-lactamase class C family)